MFTAPNPTYTLALTFVTEVDHHLDRGTRHFYDKQGQLLGTLDEIIRACLSDQFDPLPHRAGQLMEADYLTWLDSG